MKASKLAADRRVEIIEIGHSMNQSGLSKSFIASAVETAFEFEGVYDLLKMWSEEKDQKEKDEIVADIQDLVDDCAQKDKIEGTYVRFDDLDAIAKNIRGFKDNLRLLVDKQGGIGHLSQITGIPQPSLSRFFGETSMPRRTTLLKIAKALNLSQVQIATEWAR